MTKVYDIDGTERSLEWLRQTWDGCEVLPARIPAGATEYWSLEAIYCTTGPHILKIETRRGDAPASNQPVAVTWPSLENPDAGEGGPPPAPSNPNNWSTRAVIQRTDSSGISGFGVGSWGPFYHAWVWSDAPSDCLHKAGMMGGTDHSGPLHGVWVLRPVEPAHATLQDALLWHGAREQVIQLNPDAALQKRILAANFIPTSREFPVEYQSVGYIGQRAEHLGTGEVRVYYARMGDWTNVAYVKRP